MIPNDRYKHSNKMFNQAIDLIPTGSQTFSKSHLQYPKGRSPLFINSGKGALVWDVDNNPYYDLVSALLPVVLGHCDKDVNNAIKKQLDKGILFSLPTELEIKLATKLNQLIPCAEKVRFAKNGSDATAAAVRLSRAFTNRNKVISIGFHGWHDWYVGSTSRNKGVPENIAKLTYRLKFGNIEDVNKFLKAYHSDVAALILEPYPLEDPPPGYLEDLRSLCTKYGIILIFDEVVTGFRLSLGGAQEYYGVVPDLACFGKSMGNGMPISAIVGRSDIMNEMDEVFISGTYGGETLSLAASIATIEKLERINGIDLLWENGKKLFKGIKDLIMKFNLNNIMYIQGCGPWFTINFKGDQNLNGSVYKTRFIEICLENGILTNGTQNISCAFSTSIIDKVLKIYLKIFTQFFDEYERNKIKLKVGKNIVEPIFKTRN